VDVLTEPKATDKQIQFIEKLQAERGLPIIDDRNRPTKKEASALITELLATPKPTSARRSHVGDPAWESADGDPAGYGDPEFARGLSAPFEAPAKPAKREDWRQAAIPTGYYATPSLTGNQDLDFWKVDSPTDGKWAGYTFVKRVIGGHDDQDIPRDSKKKVSSERVAKATQRNAIAAILKMGIEESGVLFSTELKYCRRCGIHLTDETSRAIGMGPTCRAA
jgi:hypothetical protein